ncbi:tRNA (adenosine(37)-N6)-dimethylallyltransferase MiaA [Candidatus Uhrbacteria bacterium]|nr:tRNA (adenosine(37)-N6)-dimethylallyltransferase MiaA [Candidatus Uhrbacteria bacterium]
MGQASKIPLIVILGPTSAGKTALSLTLAKKFNGEIVSADSRQVYRGLDIGTGKATVRERRGIAHHLIDWKNPGNTISLAEYKKAADAAILGITQRGKIPFLVGGSALYLKAVVDNYLIPLVAPQPKLRKKLDRMTTSELVRLLKRHDAITASKIDIENRRRIIRALEVTLTSGKPFSSLQRKGEPLYSCLKIGPLLTREDLYKKIDDRLDARVKRGLIAEVQHLLDSGVSSSWLSSLGLEYRHITAFLRDSRAKNIDVRNEYISTLKYAIHDFARRQLVWFRKDPQIEWIAPTNIAHASRLIRKFLF